MNATMWVDGVASTQLSLDDRGLAYGDGLFETLYVVAGKPRLWSWHWARVSDGCRRLGLPVPAETEVLAEIASACAGSAWATLRFSLTRGSGPRGYAPPTPATPRRLMWVQPLTAPQVTHEPAELAVRICAMRWSEQPRLAGIKHLNRLDQVLARAEWQDPAWAEGIMLDQRGRVISATAANLFAVIAGRCLTPALDRCGIAGVTRAWLLAEFPQIEVVDLELEQLQQADEVVLTSSLRGVAVVTQLAARRLSPGEWGRTLHHHWAAMAAAHELEALQRDR